MKRMLVHQHQVWATILFVVALTLVVLSFALTAH
jgi:hypothetical protein